MIDSYTSASATPPGGGTGYGFDSPETAQLEVAIKSHDSSMIAVGDAGGSVFVWQISSARTLLDRFADQTAAITGLAFTPDDSAIAAISGSADGLREQPDRDRQARSLTSGTAAPQPRDRSATRSPTPARRVTARPFLHRRVS